MEPIPLRCWYIDDGENHLIQVQADKFVRNWRQVGGGQKPYPRYELLCADFRKEWENFTEFLKLNNLPAPRPLQCDLTYINNIDDSEKESGFPDLSKVVTFWKDPTSAGFLPAVESASINLAYVLEKPTDRLRVTLQHAIRMRDTKNILQLSLVARVKPASEMVDDLLASFDRGHECIVRAFTEFTTPAMHRTWKRRI